jgi:flagellar FliJ protein
MPKYRFKLATLQRVREARRDRERAALAEAFHAEQVLAERQASLAAEQKELRALQRSAAAHGYLDVSRLLEAQRYELVLKAREAELAQQAATVAAETERRRQVLVEADREVRVLELLDERQRREHQRHARRAETRHLDEAANGRHEGAWARRSW